MYHLFGYDNHYRNGHHHRGGMGDYMNSFDTIEAAKKFALANKRDEYEIVVQKEGDYINPSKLIVIEAGKRIGQGETFTIAWVKME